MKPDLRVKCWVLFLNQLQNGTGSKLKALCLHLLYPDFIVHSNIVAVVVFRDI